MQHCVLCLPLTVPSEVNPGFAMTPFVLSTVSRLTGLTSVCCINLTGLRYEGIAKHEVSKRFEQFRKLLDRLGTSIGHYWTDNEPGHVARLQGYCEQLVETGDLQTRIAPTLICQCGAAEVVEEAINSDWSMDRKVLHQRDGRVFCRRCNTPLKAVRKPCLLLESRFGGKPLATFPSFYQKEVEMLQEGFGQLLLVSRQRKSGYRVSLFGRTWRLDTDFCWSLLFCSLLEDGFQPDAVIVSSRSLKPLVWSVGISRKLSRRLSAITVVVTPFVRFEASSPKPFSIGTLKQLIDRYGRSPTRLLLGSGLKWNQKEVVVSSSTIFWVLKALARDSVAIPSAVKATFPLSEVLPLTDGHVVDRLIANLRKEERVPLSAYQNLLLGKERR